MLKTYTWPHYAYKPAPEMGREPSRRVPLVIVGAGPVGLSAARAAERRVGDEGVEGGRSRGPPNH